MTTVKTARISDLTAPATLATGEIGIIQGHATNTGDEDIVLYVDFIDWDTLKVLDKAGPFSTTPAAPILSFKFTFTMPIIEFHWMLKLHD